MDEQKHHEELIKGHPQRTKTDFGDESPQAIYIYLDDTHKVCNKKFADLLGYSSPAEWAKMEAPLSDVVEKDQQSVIVVMAKLQRNWSPASLK